MDSRLKLMLPWDEIEDGAQKQIQEVLQHEFVKRLVICPDVHEGYSLPIGSVALLDGYVSPAYVGYDIGCGMCLVNTTISRKDLGLNTQGALKDLYGRILKRIPVGFNCHTRPQRLNFVPYSMSGSENLDLINETYCKETEQIGTLGSGNHFIEIGVDPDDCICITIHSGSRKCGHSIASFYMKQGNFLLVNSELGQDYLRDQNWALQYALANRRRMMEVILEELGFNRGNISVLLQGMTNETHNHAIVTPQGILHRKGATPADKGQIGVIPGNMRDGVYVTFGLGNDEYLSSSSHGAGRVLSRKKATKTLSIGAFQKAMDGIMANVSEKTLDESPMAYKDLNTVIERQKGTVVEVMYHIKPILNIKG